MGLRTVALLVLLLSLPSSAFPAEVARIGVNIPLTGRPPTSGSTRCGGGNRRGRNQRIRRRGRQTRPGSGP